MRVTLIAALFVVSSLSARAGSGATPGQSCIAVGSGVSHVAATVANPADCCTGHLQCAQFLSTTTVVRPAHDQRT